MGSFFFYSFGKDSKNKKMKKILLATVSIFFGLSSSAQKLNHKLVNNDLIPYKEILEVYKPNQNNIQTSSIQRNVIWYEGFSNGIPSSWSFNGYYTNSNSIQIPFPDMTQNPPVYGWEYRGPNTTPSVTEGSIGLYSGIANNPPTNDPITSNSTNDGFIIFDSDFLDNGNVAMGSGPAPTPHVGILITDTIDCSNYQNIQLKMNTYHRSFFGQTFVVFSSDAGQNWPDTVELHNLEVNEATDIENVEIINVSDYIGGSANAQMQFIFEGATDGNVNGTGYYFWQVDDIELSELPNYDLRLYSNDFIYDNNDVINYGQPYYGFEIRDYVGQIPYNQVDSISFGFGCLNFGAVSQSYSSDITINDANGNMVYNHSELSNYLLQSNQDTFLLHSQKFLPTTTNEYIITYSVNSDSIDASPSDNELTKGFVVTDTIFNPFYFNTDDIDIMGTGNFTTGGDDGFKMANLISIIEADELTSVTIGLNTSSSDQYNTVPGGLVLISVFDTVGFYSSSIENPIIISDFHTITQADVDNNSATIPIPTSYLGSPQDRNLNPGSYYVSVEMYNNAGANNIRIQDDESTLRYPWESIVYLAGDRWYTNGNAFNIAANFGTWVPNNSSNIEEVSNSNIVVYPNPTSGNVKISFSVDELAKTSISIKDITGKTLQYINKGNLSTGIYTEQIDLSNFVKGIYLFELCLNNKTSNGKIVLTK